MVSCFVLLSLNSCVCCGEDQPLRDSCRPPVAKPVEEANLRCRKFLVDVVFEEVEDAARAQSSLQSWHTLVGRLRVLRIVNPRLRSI